MAAITWATLTRISMDELTALYATDAPETQARVLAELARRDRRDRAASARRVAIAAEWHDMAYAQYLAAEAQCNGYLLSREGLAAGIDPWQLWAGPETRALRLASEELRNFWLANRRVTLTEYRAQYAAGERAQRAEYEEAAAARHICRCGCGAEVARTFAPGHDSRLASSLRAAYRAGELTRDAVLAAAASVSERFHGKLIRALA